MVIIDNDYIGNMIYENGSLKRILVDGGYIENDTGGREFDDIAIGEWDSPQQFMNSQYNSEGDKSNENSNSYGYSEGYVIPATSEQDEIIRDEFTRISQGESYDILLNNCATAVHRFLVAGGVKVYQTYNKRATSILNIKNPHLLFL